MTKFLDWAQKNTVVLLTSIVALTSIVVVLAITLACMHQINEVRTSIVLLALIVLVVTCMIWLGKVVKLMRPDRRPIVVQYTYKDGKKGKATSGLRPDAEEDVKSDELHFRVYRETEENLRNQMNSWLTILTLLGVMLGLAVPLAGYLLQKDSLKEEKDRIVQEATKAAVRETTKAAVDEAMKAAKIEAEKISKAAEERMKESVNAIANRAIDDARKSLEGKMESKIGEFQKMIGSKKNVSPSKFEETLNKAKQGDAQAQFDVAGMYYFGNGCVKDYEEACAWWRKAAKQGQAKAQFVLGAMLENGRGCEKDEKAAVEWYRKAAEQGDAAAQNNLGYMLAEGRGCEKDEAAAVDLYRKAAEQGDADAQNNLGWMLAEGRGCEANGKEALRWLHESEKQGNAYAQESLGEVYEYGKAGIKKDPDEAKKWYRKALANPNADDVVKKLATEGLARIGD